MAPMGSDAEFVEIDVAAGLGGVAGQFGAGDAAAEIGEMIAGLGRPSGPGR